MAQLVRRRVVGGRLARAVSLSAFGAVLLGGLAPPSAALQSGTLIAVSPLGASPGVAISITGVGFNTTAANNLVTFTPPSGTPQTVAASSVATVDAAKGWRRITVTVPSGLPAATSALTVTNSTTGASSSGLGIDVLHLSPPVPAAGAAGATGLSLLITASPNTDFTAGQALVNLGAGVTVRGLAVLSRTQLRATIDIAATAAPGPRVLVARATNQSLILSSAFEVTPPAPANRPPVC